MKIWSFEYQKGHWDICVLIKYLTNTNRVKIFKIKGKQGEERKERKKRIYIKRGVGMKEKKQAENQRTEVDQNIKKLDGAWGIEEET